jgi:hypothetical protein
MIDATYAHLPASCSSTGGLSMNDINSIGAKGILGIGTFQQDSPACAYDTSAGYYYACDSNVCIPTLVPLESQVVNPVAMLPTHNNGIVISLPSVQLPGQAGLQGKLLLGINTSSNNQITTESIYDLDNYGYLTTTYQGNSFTQSYIDSGSNGLFFTDPSLPLCPSSSGFYCPLTELERTATIVSHSRLSRGAITFHIGNADLMNNASAVMPDLAGTASTGTFAWGLPFFYGRKVFVSIAGKSLSGSLSPIIAF